MEGERRERGREGGRQTGRKIRKEGGERRIAKRVRMAKHCHHLENVLAGSSLGKVLANIPVHLNLRFPVSLHFHHLLLLHFFLLHCLIKNLLQRFWERNSYTAIVCLRISNHKYDTNWSIHLTTFSLVNDGKQIT